MAVQLKPLSDQVMFITGASSGIGRVTARRAAEAGAKVVLVARNEDALREAVNQITQAGGQAIYAVADVTDIEQIRSAAEAGVSAFGRIDTWVNNAGVGMFTDITDPSHIEDDKKLFETNFWGIVHGSRLAVNYLRDGGALINLGSEVSDAAVPVQGIYSASKHAIMGFTDAFRTEVISNELPISVTLIKPAAIDTPYAKHAQNNTGKATTLPAPVYSPELVADQILHAAQHPVRDLYVGGGGRAMAFLAEHFPTISDWVIGKLMPGQQLKDEPADTSNQNLHNVGGAYEERGGLQGERMVREHSLYGLVSRHPYAVTFGVAAVSAAAAYLLLREPEPELTKTEQWRKAAREKAAGFGDTARGYVKQALSEAQRYATDARVKASDYAGAAREYAHDAGESAKGFASDYASRVRDSAATARQGFSKAAGHSQAHAEDAVDRLRDVATEYLGQPAEQLISTIKKNLSKYLG